MTVPDEQVLARTDREVDGQQVPDSDEVADRVAAAVLAVRGVADLHAGMFGEVGTYLPGRRVRGIKIADSVTDVHVSLFFDAVVVETADRVRSAVSELIGGTVNVFVEDLVPTESASAHLSGDDGGGVASDREQKLP